MSPTYLNRNSNGQGKKKLYSPSSNKPFVDVSDTVDKAEIAESYRKAKLDNRLNSSMLLGKVGRYYKNNNKKL